MRMLRKGCGSWSLSIDCSITPATMVRAVDCVDTMRFDRDTAKSPNLICNSVYTSFFYSELVPEVQINMRG
jgi:hypothetical protein